MPALVAPSRARAGRYVRHLLLLPTALLTVVCFVIPLVLIAVYSFGSENLVTFNVFFGKGRTSVLIPPPVTGQ